MIQIEELLSDFQQFPDLVNNQFKQGGDLNILFVAPQMIGSDFYRMILPYIVLKRTGVCSTAITGISKYNPQTYMKKHVETPLQSKHILWAHRIVFPFVNYDLSPVIEAIQRINPISRICINIDFDFINLPEKHPLKPVFDKETNEIILNNIKLADLVMVSNTSLPKYIGLPDSYLGKLRAPWLCADPDTMLDGMSRRERVEGAREYFNVCVLCKEDQLGDLESVAENLRELKKKHGKKLVVTIFGINQKKSEAFRQIMKGIEYVPESPVAITKYYLKLKDINPDLVLVPIEETPFNLATQDYRRFVDCGVMGFPIITPELSPMSDIITHEENGFLYKDQVQFLAIMNGLIADKTKIRDAGRGARDLVQERFCYNFDTLQRLIDIFDEEEK